MCPHIISRLKAHHNIDAYVRLGSKADMCSALGDVRFVPIADIRPQDNAGGKSSGDNPGFEER